MANSKTKAESKTSQKQRFIATAKELEVDESGEQFERAFAKIVPPKRTMESDK